MMALVALFILPFVASADNTPNCSEKVKEELARQSLSWSKSETEDRDSDTMADEYHSQNEILQKFEGGVPLPVRPEFEKYKSLPAYRRALDEWSSMTMEAMESRRKILIQSKPEYKSALAIVEKYKTPGERFFFDFVRDGSTEFNKILFFPNKAKAKVIAYVKDDRIQGYHASHASGENDIIRFDYSCKIDGIFVHHGKAIEKIGESICDHLPELKPLVEAAAANPGDDVEDLPMSALCSQQGGDWDGENCVCAMYKGKLLQPVNPIEGTCLDERHVSTGQRLRDFADANDSHIEPDLNAIPIVERVCKRYFTVAVKAPAPSTRTPAKASSQKK